MMQRGFFDAAVADADVSAVDVIEAPIADEVRAPRIARGLDVIRVLEHKAGPFRELGRVGNEVQVVREYRIIERPTGYYAEFTDGKPERRCVGLGREFVESMVRQKMWREVEP